jgi:aminopeptidase N
VRKGYGCLHHDLQRWLLTLFRRPQANVIAHEIAHSWCGNLVTNRTWEHFW